MPSDPAASTSHVIASATDWIDGYIARRFDQVSKLGTMLDPISDKVIVLITLVTVVALSGPNALVLIPAILIVFREVFVSGLREFLGPLNVSVPVSRLAKWKTTLQMLALGSLITFIAIIIGGFIGMKLMERMV